ncbi:hypothetical protein B1F79_04805 [Coxiella-like endosymbiont of Rhipicephalus sanguineus]|nr:hypothetical protein [Coxiella-like endosymbiont of Rhipicephalus sanguineus]
MGEKLLLNGQHAMLACFWNTDFIFNIPISNLP